MPEFNAFKKDEQEHIETQNHQDGSNIELQNKDGDVPREEPAVLSQPKEQSGNVEAPSETSMFSQVSHAEPLPPLHTPHRRRQIKMWAGLLLVTADLCALPITYYYALNFGTNLPLQDVFAVITSVYGLISFSHFGLRSLKLFRAKSAPRWRPVGWTRWGMLEFLHLNFLIAVSLVEIELIIGTIPHNPWVRLCAMCSPTLCYWFGFVFVISAILTHLERPLPFNMSSTEKGKPWRPALLAIIEDAGAIEGEGGVVYRSNVMRRYEVSPVFRRMVMMLTWFWGIGLICIATVATCIIMLLPENIGFGIGWGLPYAFGFVWVLITMAFVKFQLKREKAHWEIKSSGAGQAVAPFS